MQLEYRADINMGLAGAGLHLNGKVRLVGKRVFGNTPLLGQSPDSFANPLLVNTQHIGRHIPRPKPFLRPGVRRTFKNTDYGVVEVGFKMEGA